jgi:hypothetical protein
MGKNEWWCKRWRWVWGVDIEHRPSSLLVRQSVDFLCRNSFFRFSVSWILEIEDFLRDDRFSKQRHSSSPSDTYAPHNTTDSIHIWGLDYRMKSEDCWKNNTIPNSHSYGYSKYEVLVSLCTPVWAWQWPGILDLFCQSISSPISGFSSTLDWTCWINYCWIFSLIDKSNCK